VQYFNKNIVLSLVWVVLSTWKRYSYTAVSFTVSINAKTQPCLVNVDVQKGQWYEAEILVKIAPLASELRGLESPPLKKIKNEEKTSAKHIGLALLANMPVYLSVCPISNSVSFARWQYARVVAWNALDRGQHGRLCSRPNDISGATAYRFAAQSLGRNFWPNVQIGLDLVG